MILIRYKLFVLLTQMVLKFIHDLHFGPLTKLFIQMVPLLFIIRQIGLR